MKGGKEMGESTNGVERITLEWSAGRKLREFALDTSDDHRKRFDRAGVYLWVVAPPNDDAYVSYVGKATGSPTLLGRMRTHFVLHMGVGYSMPVPFVPQKYVVHSRSGRKRWEVNWSSDVCLNVLADEEQVIELTRCGFRLTNAITVYVANVDKVQVKAVERQLLWDLHPQGTDWGTKTAPAPRTVDIWHKNAGWATELMRRGFKSPLQVVP